MTTQRLNALFGPIEGEPLVPFGIPATMRVSLAEPGAAFLAFERLIVRRARRHQSKMNARDRVERRRAETGEPGSGYLSDWAVW